MRSLRQQVEVFDAAAARRYGQPALAAEPLYRYEDRLKVEQTLHEHLLNRNRPEAALRNAGRYLVESFGAGVGDEYPAAYARSARVDQ